MIDDYLISISFPESSLMKNDFACNLYDGYSETTDVLTSILLLRKENWKILNDLDIDEDRF